MTETHIDMLLVIVPDGPQEDPFFNWVRMIKVVRDEKVINRIVAAKTVIKRKTETQMITGIICH